MRWLDVNFISLCWIYTFYKIFRYKSLLLTHGNKFLLHGKVSEKFTLLWLACYFSSVILSHSHWLCLCSRSHWEKFTENNILTFLLIAIMMRNHFCVDRVLLSVAFSLIMITLQTKLCLHNPAFCHK